MTIRQEGINAARFLTFGCFKRKYLFRYHHLADLFVEHLDHWRSEEKIQLWAFVVMINHIHLLVFAPEVDIRKSLKKLKARTGREALTRLQIHDKPTYESLEVLDHGNVVHRFWQTGGGHDRMINTEKDLVARMNYIHNNPKQNDLIEVPEDYRWSSARFWKTGEPVPLRMDIPYWWKE
ncbi:transposase [bacterium]|nr:transposase [bacterium]